MGFFSALIGPALGLAGSLFGASSQRKAAKQQNANDMAAMEKQNQYNQEAATLERERAIEDLAQSMPRLRESAESAGYNPLTALMTGGAPAYANAPSGVGSRGVVAKLATPSLIGNAISGVGDIITGYQAQKAQEKRANEQLQAINNQRGLGDIPAVKQTYKNTVQRTSAVPQTQTLTTIAPKPQTPQDYKRVVKPKLSPITPDEMHVAVDYTTSSGETVKVPVGPDLDEIASGIGIEATGTMKKKAKDWLAYDRALQDGEHPLNPYPGEKLANTPRLGANSSLPSGVEKPSGWDRWHPDRQNSWLVRWGHKKP